MDDGRDHPGEAAPQRAGLEHPLVADVKFFLCKVALERRYSLKRIGAVVDRRRDPAQVEERRAVLPGPPQQIPEPATSQMVLEARSEGRDVAPALYSA